MSIKNRVLGKAEDVQVYRDLFFRLAQLDDEEIRSGLETESPECTALREKVRAARAKVPRWRHWPTR